MRKRILVGGAAVLVAAALAQVISIQRTAHSAPAAKRAASEATVAPAPERSLRLLFIHHSVGSQLLAEPGSDDKRGEDSRGGGFRRLLERAGYQVHTATYGSTLGERTDLFDWPEKFSQHLDEVVVTKDGSGPLADSAKHDVVLFKSCFPNNEFEGRGNPPGNPEGPELTVENAKAALKSLLPHFEKQQNTLFVLLTTPPLAPKTYPEPLWKWAIKSALGKGSAAKLTRQAELSREFSDWVVASNGWLAGYPRKNVAAIDYYDMLTGDGASNLLLYPSADGSDSHPSSEGQRKAAPRLLSELNRAVERSGLGRRADNAALGAEGTAVAVTGSP